MLENLKDDTEDRSVGGYVFLGSVYCCVYSPVLVALGYFLSKIIYGSCFVNDCATSPMVPISLIVSGCLPLVVGGVSLLIGHRAKAKAEATGDKLVAYRYILLALFTAMLIWIIVESPFVFLERSAAASRSVNSTGCSPKLLTFSFVTLIIDWVAVSVGFTAFLCCWCSLELVRSLCNDSSL